MSGEEEDPLIQSHPAESPRRRRPLLPLTKTLACVRGDEDPVQRVRGRGGAGAVLRGRGGALRGLRRGGARRQQARGEAPAGAAALGRRRRRRGGARRAQVRHLPGQAPGPVCCLCLARSSVRGDRLGSLHFWGSIGGWLGQWVGGGWFGVVAQ